jgi:predicted DCC family thiol-disulfide oxidoreductase YuxK
MATPTATQPDPAAGKAIVLYDGMCPLCQRSVRLLKRLDWFGTLHFQDARDTDHLPPCEPPLEPERLLEQMHLVTPDRKQAHAGYAAVRWMAWRIPLLWPLAPLLSVPGVPQLGDQVYRWVARNRFHLVPCHGGVCRVPIGGKGNESQVVAPNR